MNSLQLKSQNPKALRTVLLALCVESAGSNKVLKNNASYGGEHVPHNPLTAVRLKSAVETQSRANAPKGGGKPRFSSAIRQEPLVPLGLAPVT